MADVGAVCECWMGLIVDVVCYVKGWVVCCVGG